MATVPNLPSEIHATFSGPINSETLQKIAKGFDVAMQAKVSHIHLFFHSTGGSVGDGVALYNYFKTLPLELTIYNPGIVASIGVIAYLGAAHRVTSRHAVFMIHRTRCNIPQGTPAFRAQTMVDSAILDDKRTEAILKERLSLPAEKWKHFDNNDLFFSADEAVRYGIAERIGDFSPTGQQIYDL